jgi:hypothetical protein
MDTIVITLASMAITPLLLVLLFRWFTYRVLWKVRNRLILTYLLMGLAPLVMFVMLMGIASYLLAGQYATNVGLSRLTEGLTRVRDQAGSAAIFGSGRGGEDSRGSAVPTKKGSSRFGRYGWSGEYWRWGVRMPRPLSLMELKGKRGCRWRGCRRRTMRDR